MRIYAANCINTWLILLPTQSHAENRFNVKEKIISIKRIARSLQNRREKTKSAIYAAVISVHWIHKLCFASPSKVSLIATNEKAWIKMPHAHSGIHKKRIFIVIWAIRDDINIFKNNSKLLFESKHRFSNDSSVLCRPRLMTAHTASPMRNVIIFSRFFFSLWYICFQMKINTVSILCIVWCHAHPNSRISRVVSPSLTSKLIEYWYLFWET